jgi:hypothetical protein
MHWVQTHLPESEGHACSSEKLFPADPVGLPVGDVVVPCIAGFTLQHQERASREQQRPVVSVPPELHHRLTAKRQ